VLAGGRDVDATRPAVPGTVSCVVGHTVREGPGRSQGEGHAVTESQIEAVEGIEVGPVDVIVIEFADAKFRGEGLPILLDLVAKGIIRIIDAVAIKANEDGSFVSLSIEDLDQAGGEWELISGWSSDVLGQDDLDEVGAILKPGAAAAIIMYENSWAAPFAAAMRRAGGELVAFDRIPVTEVIAALEAAESTAIES
jgi:Family of unknown function (DUF6325)